MIIGQIKNQFLQFDKWSYEKSFLDALLERLCDYLKIDGKFVQNFYGFVYSTVP